METKLYEAAIKGDKDQLLDLVQENVDILNRVTVVGLKEESPLHIAAQLGHVDFVTEILNRRPEYVRDLNSQGQSPLHLASERGHLNVVEVLLEKDKGICFFRDKDGRTPLQLAAMRGRLEVVEELVCENRAAAWMLTNDGEPILHLCAKSNQFGAVERLVGLVTDIGFLNMKDRQDNTILHILAGKGENKVIRHLAGKRGLDFDVNIRNVYGLTVFDVLLENINGLGCLSAISVLIDTRPEFRIKWLSTIPDNTRPMTVTENYNQTPSEGLLVLATLMATVAFQSAMNPPGGVWQDTAYHNLTTFNSNGTLTLSSQSVVHRAGESVMAYLRKEDYKSFCIWNSLTLFSSLYLLILILASDFRVRFSRWALYILLCVSLWSMTFSCQLAISLLSTSEIYKLVGRVTLPTSWIGILLITTAVIFPRNFVRQWIRIRCSGAGAAAAAAAGP